MRPFLSREVVLQGHEDDYDMSSDESLMEFLELQARGTIEG